MPLRAIQCLQSEHLKCLEFFQTWWAYRYDVWRTIHLFFFHVNHVQGCLSSNVPCFRLACASFFPTRSSQPRWIRLVSPQKIPDEQKVLQKCRLAPKWFERSLYSPFATMTNSCPSNLYCDLDNLISILKSFSNNMRNYRLKGIYRDIKTSSRNRSIIRCMIHGCCEATMPYPVPLFHPGLLATRIYQSWSSGITIRFWKSIKDRKSVV